MKREENISRGLPQSPIFSDIFLSFHEEMWLSNCPIEFKPIFYRRYVDDTVSVRTGRPLSQPPQSHIRDHLLSCNGPQVNLKHIDIIGTCQNKTELRILESLHILQRKPTLNCMQSVHPLNIIK